MNIDMSFVQEVTSDPEWINLVSAKINISKSLKQHVIAEGVENRSQLEFLLRSGCSEAQGYYFSQPISAESAGRLMKTGLSVSGDGFLASAS